MNLAETPGRAKPDRLRLAGGVGLSPYIATCRYVIGSLDIADMLLSSVVFALLPVALAQYVVPAADGSDGWQDAFVKAKGMSGSYCR